MSDNITRPGSVRYKRDGAWIVTSPGDPLYSAALYAAEEVYMETGWETMSGEDDGRSNAENV